MMLTAVEASLMVGAIVAPSIGSTAAARSGFSRAAAADELGRVCAVLADSREEVGQRGQLGGRGAACAGFGR